MDTELVITFAQQKLYWFGLTPGNWIALLAIAITVILAIPALLQWSSNKIAHKQSNTPILRSDFRAPSERQSGLVEISNKGLGPAFLKEINVHLNGEILKAELSVACEHAIEEIGRSARGNTEIIKTYSYQQGYPVSVDESIPIIEFNCHGLPGPDAFMWEMKEQRVQFEVVYEDIFGKRHIAFDPQRGKEL
mgnify:CR=1 FL=1